MNIYEEENDPSDSHYAGRTKLENTWADIGAEDDWMEVRESDWGITGEVKTFWRLIGPIRICNYVKKVVILLAEQ